MALVFKISLLFAIVSLSATSQIIWSRYKNARSITVNETSYSTTYTLGPYGNIWKSVSVFGPHVQAYDDERVVYVFSIFVMTRNMINLIEEAYHRANGDDSCGPGFRLSEPERYVFEGDVMKSSLGGRENFISYSRNGYFVFMLDGNKYSVSGPSLPEEVERVFVDDDMMGIVEKDGNTIMRPIKSLSLRPDHEDLLREIRRSVRPIESERRLLSSIDHRLAEMEKNLINKASALFNEYDIHEHSFEDLEVKIDYLSS